MAPPGQARWWPLESPRRLGFNHGPTGTSPVVASASPKSAVWVVVNHGPAALHRAWTHFHVVHPSLRMLRVHDMKVGECVFRWIWNGSV